MRRTNIYFTERQWTELEKRAQRIGIPIAELIRRILDEYLFGEKERTK